MTDNICPTCGDSFKSPTGMKNHHRISHGESLSTVTMECGYCGSKIKKKEYELEESGNGYCDHECYTKDKSKPQKKAVECDNCGQEFEAKKSSNGRYKKYCSEDCRWANVESPNPNKEANKINCDYCGQSFRRKPSSVHDRNYCSQNCMGNHRRELYQGKGNPAHKGEKHKECKECDTQYSVKPSLVQSSKYCSKECHNQSLRTKGSAFFAETLEYSIGPNWREQREKRLERDDYMCVVCKMSDQEHKKRYSQGLHVHHIQPRRMYFDGDTYDYKSANRVENLVTLCHDCHNRWEGIPLRPQQ